MSTKNYSPFFLKTHVIPHKIIDLFFNSFMIITKRSRSFSCRSLLASKEVIIKITTFKSYITKSIFLFYFFFRVRVKEGRKNSWFWSYIYVNCFCPRISAMENKWFRVYLGTDFVYKTSVHLFCYETQNFSNLSMSSLYDVRIWKTK